jgi:glycosyltransferase involved in cell wall biosynthesis
MRCPTVDELCPPPAGQKGWPWTEGSAPLPPTTPNGALWPKVSIVTPSYNQGLFLEETIRSVLLQGYPSLEYIVIDGGSTDGSVEIIRKYEKWLAHWVSEPDRGQSHAINKGFTKATGEIVAWLNSDDVYERRALQQAAQFLVDHQVDMVYADSHIIDENGRRTGTTDSPTFHLADLLMDSFVPQQAAFFQRQVTDVVGLLNESFNYAMDYDLWLRIANRFSVRKAPGIWANYRICKGTKSFGEPAAFWPEIVQALERFYSQPNLSPSLEKLKPQALAHANLRAAVEYYQRNRITEGQNHLAAAFNVNPLLEKNPKEVLQVLVRFGSILRPEASQEFVNVVFDNLPAAALNLKSKRFAVARRALLLSLNRYEPARGRAWIVTNFFELLLDWRWIVQRPIFGICLFLLGGERVRKVAGLRHRIHPKAAMFLV